VLSGVGASAADPLVLHNDDMDIDAIHEMLLAGDVHHIILSPGPGTPHDPKDIGEPVVPPL
jgi:para-aminobenzoate synthetase